MANRSVATAGAIERHARPGREAWFEDGSAELGYGVWLSLFGATCLVVAGVAAHWLGLGLWASNLAMAGITVIDLRVVRRLKRRMTFPWAVIVALTAPALGMSLAILGADGYLGTGIEGLAVGALVTIAGALRLRRFSGEIQ